MQNDAEKLEQERRLARAAGIPLSLAEAVALLGQEPNPEVDRAYRYLVATENPTDFGKIYDEFTRWVQGDAAARASLKTAIAKAETESKSILSLAERCVSFPNWPWHDDAKFELKDFLEITTVVEYLCAKAGLLAAEGDEHGAAMLLRTANTLGAHVHGRGVLLDLMTGVLITAIVDEAIKFILDTLKPSREFLAEIESLCIVPTLRPSPFAIFRIELASMYETRFLDPKLRTLRNRRGYNPVQAELAWLRASRRVYEDLARTQKQYSDILAALRKHAQPVDEETKKSADPNGTLVPGGSFSSLAWLIERVSDDMLSKDRARLALGQRARRMMAAG